MAGPPPLAQRPTRLAGGFLKRRRDAPPALRSIGALAARPRAAGQRVGAVVERRGQAVGDQRTQRPVPLLRVWPGRAQPVGRNRAGRAPEHREQAAAALAVAARIARFGRASRGSRAPGPPPGALAGDRAAGAVGPGRGADQGTEFHDRDRPPRGAPGRRGQQRLGQPGLGRRRAARRQVLTPHQAGQDAAHVRVQHRVPLAEREARYRGGGVAAHAGQRAQVVQRRRDLPAVPLGQDRRRGVQPQRPARIPQPVPLPDGVAGRRRGQGRRRWPPLEPCRVRRQHPCHGRLLQHDLAHQHRPGRGSGPPPRQVPGVTRVPAQYRRGIPIRHDGHDPPAAPLSSCCGPLAGGPPRRTPPPGSGPPVRRPAWPGLAGPGRTRNRERRPAGLRGGRRPVLHTHGMALNTFRRQLRGRNSLAATYWRRRVVALVVGLVILAVIAWAVSGVLGGGAGGGSGALSHIPLQDGRLGQPGQALAHAAGVRRADPVHLVQLLDPGGQQLL